MLDTTLHLRSLVCIMRADGGRLTLPVAVKAAESHSIMSSVGVVVVIPGVSATVQENGMPRNDSPVFESQSDQSTLHVILVSFSVSFFE